MVKAMPGSVGIVGVPGVLGRNVDAVTKIYEARSVDQNMNKLDPVCPPIPFDHKMLKTQKKLRIGYYKEIDFILAIPVVKNTIEDVVSKLENLGHIIVSFDIPNLYKIIALSNQFAFSDGFANHASNWRGERDPSLTSIYLLYVTPNIIKSILSSFLRDKCPQSSMGLSMRALDARQLQRCLYERSVLVQDVISACKAAELDILITPSFPHPAPPLGMATVLGPSAFYTGIYNTLDFPAGVVPVGKATAADVADLAAFPDQGNPILKAMKRSMQGMEGLPLTVQVVGLPYTEELVLNVMQTIEDKCCALTT